ncbi:hypothetical protein K8R42_05520 [bacterium]|nr:hypothetical protein [bacterium]
MPNIKYTVTNYNCPIYPLVLVLQMLKDDFYSVYGRPYYDQDYFCIYRKDLNNTFILDDLAERNAPHFVKLAKDKKYLTKVTRNIKKYAKELLQFSDSFKSKDFDKLSDQQLLRLYQDFNYKYRQLYVWGWLPLVVDAHNEYFSSLVIKNFKQFLSRFAGQKKINKFAEYFFVLSSFPEMTDREQAAIDLLKLDKEKYLFKYGWLTFNWWGPVYSQADYKTDLKNVAKNQPDKHKAKNLKVQQKQIINELKLSKKLIQEFEALSKLLYLKDYRKNIIYQANYNISFLLKEIAKRFKYPVKLLHYVLPKEMQDVFVKQISKAELEKRYKLSVLRCGVDELELFTGVKAKQIADKFLKSKIKINNAFPLQGQIASPGKAKGKVKIVNNTKDISKVKNGDILVSVKTDPTLLPAMKKASAVVTEVGGITSHAAIVARELKVPCVIGVHNVSSILKDDQIIIVDAELGIIKKI